MNTNSGNDLLPRATERLKLRQLTAADITDFQSYRTDPEVALYQDWKIMSDSDASAFLISTTVDKIPAPGEWCQIGIANLISDQLLRDIGIYFDEEGAQAEIGFALRREFQGRGLAREAVHEAIRMLFEQTDVDRVIGVTDVRNTPSVRLLESVGMEKVDTVQAMFRGQPCTEHIYSIARKT